MIIDAHQHFWIYEAVRDNWIDDTMEVIRKDFLPKNLKPILEENNFDGCIAVQADQSEEETRFLLNQAKENTFIKGVVGWVDLLSENVDERLAYYAENKKFKGVRHIVQGEANDFMLRPDFQRGISTLQKYNLTYDILVFPPQLPAAIKLANKYPDQPFVLDHMGKPYIKSGEMANWKRNIELLAKCSNVVCKISGMFTEADWNYWTEKDFTPFLDVVFTSFGVDSVLFGSDWPVCLLAADYREQLDIIKSHINKFSTTDRAKIMGNNAIRFYNL